MHQHWCGICHGWWYHDADCLYDDRTIKSCPKHEQDLDPLD